MRMDRHPRRRQNLQKRRINIERKRSAFMPSAVPTKNDEPVDAHMPRLKARDTGTTSTATWPGSRICLSRPELPHRAYHEMG
jgi:hypothetical protein